MIKDNSACPDDCKVNICSKTAPDTIKAVSEEGFGKCLADEFEAKCGCATTSAKDLAALGQPGMAGQALPPVPMMQTNFMSMEKGTQAKGTGTLLFFLSMVEYDKNVAPGGVFSGAADQIIHEIELDQKMEWGSYPVVRKNESSSDDPADRGDFYYFHMKTELGQGFELSMKCAAGDVHKNITFGDRAYDIDWNTTECDIDWTSYPFSSNSSGLAIKTAVFSQSFSEDVTDENDEGMETISVGGVKLDFAKEVKYNNSKCSTPSTGCVAPVKASAKNIACGEIDWYTPSYRAVTLREMGFSELKCTYFSFMGAFDNATMFSWDPKVILDTNAAIAKTREGKNIAPTVEVKPPLKEGEVIAGVDKVDTKAPAPKTPVVKVKYAMPVKKFDAKTSAALKAAFAKNIDGVKTEDIKITKATFDVKSTVSFASETLETFKTKEASFKKALATDLSVSEDKITVTASAKTRRHLLAGVNVDYTVTGIETFETAKSMSEVANTPSAMKGVTAAVALPKVETNAGVEAQLEFEIAAADAAAASKVSKDLASTEKLTKIAGEVPDVKAAPKVVGEITTVSVPPPPAALPPPSPSPPPNVVESGASSSAKIVLAAAATLFATLFA